MASNESAETTQPKDEIHQLLDERQTTHGDAWLIIGQYLSAFNGLTDKIKQTPYYFAWLMIFGKLVRACADPLFDDNWRDIIGYATLVRDHLKQGQGK